MATKKIKFSRQKREKKVRTKIKIYSGNKFRLSVFRSNKHFYAQLIDIKNGKTIFSMSDAHFKKINKGIKPKEIALKIGNDFGKKMLEHNIKEAVFDRSFYKFHGQVENFAKGVRDAGVKI